MEARAVSLEHQREQLEQRTAELDQQKDQLQQNNSKLLLTNLMLLNKTKHLEDHSRALVAKQEDLQHQVGWVLAQHTSASMTIRTIDMHTATLISLVGYPRGLPQQFDALIYQAQMVMRLHTPFTLAA